MKRSIIAAISVLMVVSVMLGTFVGCEKKKSEPEENTTSFESSTVKNDQSTTVSEKTTAKTEKNQEVKKTEAAEKKFYAPTSFINTGRDIVYKLEWINNNELIVHEMEHVAGKEYGDDLSSKYEIKINDFGEIVSAKLIYTEIDKNGKEDKTSSDLSKGNALKYDSNHRISELDEIDENGKVRFINKYKFDNEGKRIGRHWEYTNEKNMADISYEYQNGQLVKATFTYDNAFISDDDSVSSVYIQYKSELNSNGQPTKVQYKIPNSSIDNNWTDFQNYKYVEVTENQYNCYMNTLQYLLLDSVHDID